MQEIYEDYEKNHYNKLKDLACKLVTVLNRRKDCERRSVDTGFGMVHTIFGRAKNPEHLIEKIIRKVGTEDSAKYSQIDKNNYLNIITDLIGIRILVLAKEDWKNDI